MKVLYLGPHSPLIDFLTEYGETVYRWDQPLQLLMNDFQPDFIVSYGYRYKIPKDVVERYRGRTINLHIGYLPWNRGADPNLWSFIDNAPKGVSIHYVDDGIDTGDIICQTPVPWFDEDTLRSTYERLQRVIQAMFRDNWKEIKNHPETVKQNGMGSFHLKKDLEKVKHLLSYGWDTPVKTLIPCVIRDYGRGV